MTKQVQRRRGTATQHTSFTGAEGETSVNTTNKSVHVHDGATAGGVEAARADLVNVSDANLNAALTGNTVAALTITTADINGGTIDGTVIGGATAAAVTGTAITGTSFTTTGDMSFGDDDKAIFGAGSDLQIYHDGSHSVIKEAGTGNLQFYADTRYQFFNADGSASYAQFIGDGGAGTEYVQLRYGNSPVLATTATGIDVTGNATFPDNGKAIFGAGSDLQIYHDGSNSLISDKGTGELRLSGSSAIRILGDNGETSAVFNENGSASFRYDGATVLATTATGIDVTGTITSDGLDVTGTITSDGLTVDGDVTIAQSAGGTFLKFDVDGTIDEALIGMDSTDLIISVDPTNVRASSDFVIKNDGTETLRVNSSGIDVTGTITSDGLTVEQLIDATLRLESTENKAVFTQNVDTYGTIEFYSNDVSAGGVGIKSAIRSYVANTAGGQSSLAFSTSDGSTNDIERMNIDASGNVLVGKTSSDISVNGFETAQNGNTTITRTSGTANVNYVLLMNRKSTDGDIIDFRKDGTTVGSIGSRVGRSYIYSPYGTGAGLRFGDDIVQPTDSDGTDRDNATNLGAPTARFDDIYATNGTIQTSDRNEKQDIASLTPTEMLVAARLSTGFKNFKWKDKVAEKGDDARLHSGAIAQDVQDAFTAEGLDAGDYAMFISATWWEHDVDVPAVEAVEGVDGVQAVEAVDYAEAVEATYNEDGIELTAYVPEVQAVEAVVGVEYVEAVEAKDAYTRTDTYDTLEEAPEGATERTRLGIRYPELLSFVAAYNEQRFASIETRLISLEA
jgi:hypothetical protein